VEANSQSEIKWIPSLIKDPLYYAIKAKTIKGNKKIKGKTKKYFRFENKS